MYDDFKVANYSKALLSPELYARHLSRLFTGDVVDGLTVTPGTGLQVVLAPGNALIRYGSGALASAREASLVANFNLTIGTADGSNPRHDLVVMYVDNSVALPSGTPTAANLDGKGVVKAKIVQGTPASSPSDPNNTAIQASVGAGNPFTVLARVRVNAGVSVIAANLITDLRAMALLTVNHLDFANMDPISTSTDANGWTVYDYGLFKIGKKTASTTASKVRFESGLQDSANLPVGVGTLADLKAYWGEVGLGTLSDFVTITRQNRASTATQLTYVYLYLGPTTASSYTVPINFTVMF